MKIVFWCFLALFVAAVTANGVHRAHFASSGRPATWQGSQWSTSYTSPLQVNAYYSGSGAIGNSGVAVHPGAVSYSGYGHGNSWNNAGTGFGSSLYNSGKWQGASGLYDGYGSGGLDYYLNWRKNGFVSAKHNIAPYKGGIVLSGAGSTTTGLASGGALGVGNYYGAGSGFGIGSGLATGSHYYNRGSLNTGSSFGIGSGYNKATLIGSASRPISGVSTVAANIFGVGSGLKTNTFGSYGAYGRGSGWNSGSFFAPAGIKPVSAFSSNRQIVSGSAQLSQPISLYPSNLYSDGKWSNGGVYSGYGDYWKRQKNGFRGAGGALTGPYAGYATNSWNKYDTSNIYGTKTGSYSANRFGSGLSGSTGIGSVSGFGLGSALGSGSAFGTKYGSGNRYIVRKGDGLLGSSAITDSTGSYVYSKLVTGSAPVAGPSIFSVYGTKINGATVPAVGAGGYSQYIATNYQNRPYSTTGIAPMYTQSKWTTDNSGRQTGYYSGYGQFKGTRYSPVTYKPSYSTVISGSAQLSPAIFPAATLGAGTSGFSSNLYNDAKWSNSGVYSGYGNGLDFYWRWRKNGFHGAVGIPTASYNYASGSYNNYDGSRRPTYSAYNTGSSSAGAGFLGIGTSTTGNYASGLNLGGYGSLYSSQIAPSTGYANGWLSRYDGTRRPGYPGKATYAQSTKYNGPTKVPLTISTGTGFIPAYTTTVTSSKPILAATGTLLGSAGPIATSVYTKPSIQTTFTAGRPIAQSSGAVFNSVGTLNTAAAFNPAYSGSVISSAPSIGSSSYYATGSTFAPTFTSTVSSLKPVSVAGGSLFESAGSLGSGTFVAPALVNTLALSKPVSSLAKPVITTLVPAKPFSLSGNSLAGSAVFGSGTIAPSYTVKPVTSTFVATVPIIKPSSGILSTVHGSGLANGYAYTSPSIASSVFGTSGLNAGGSSILGFGNKGAFVTGSKFQSRPYALATGISPMYSQSKWSIGDGYYAGYGQASGSRYTPASFTPTYISTAGAYRPSYAGSKYSAVQTGSAQLSPAIFPNTFGTIGSPGFTSNLYNGYYGVKSKPVGYAGYASGTWSKYDGSRRPNYASNVAGSYISNAGAYRPSFAGSKYSAVHTGSAQLSPAIFPSTFGTVGSPGFTSNLYNGYYGVNSKPVGYAGYASGTWNKYDGSRGPNYASNVAGSGFGIGAYASKFTATNPSAGYSSGQWNKYTAGFPASVSTGLHSSKWNTITSPSVASTVFGLSGSSVSGLSPMYSQSKWTIDRAGQNTGYYAGYGKYSGAKYSSINTRPTYAGSKFSNIYTGAADLSPAIWPGTTSNSFSKYNYGTGNGRFGLGGLSGYTSKLAANIPAGVGILGANRYGSGWSGAYNPASMYSAGRWTLNNASGGSGVYYGYAARPSYQTGTSTVYSGSAQLSPAIYPAGNIASFSGSGNMGPLYNRGEWRNNGIYSGYGTGLQSNWRWQGSGGASGDRSNLYGISKWGNTGALNGYGSAYGSAGWDSGKASWAQGKGSWTSGPQQGWKLSGTWGGLANSAPVAGYSQWSTSWKSPTVTHSYSWK